MSLNDTLSNMMSNIMNAELVGKTECTIKPISKVLIKVLTIMKDNGYIGEFTSVEDGKGNFIKINLIGKINKCKAIKPRYIVKAPNLEKFEKRFLPAKDFGFLLITTNKGIISHKQAAELKIGGKLLAFFY